MKPGDIQRYHEPSRRVLGGTPRGTHEITEVKGRQALQPVDRLKSLSSPHNDRRFVERVSRPAQNGGSGDPPHMPHNADG